VGWRECEKWGSRCARIRAESGTTRRFDAAVLPRAIAPFLEIAVVLAVIRTR